MKTLHYLILAAFLVLAAVLFFGPYRWTDIERRMVIALRPVGARG